MRVVRHQARAGNVEVAHNLHRQVVLALVGLKPQRHISFNGVQPLLLQGVSPDFVVQANAAPFLAEIDQRAGAVFKHHPNRQIQLLAAVAFQTAESVPGEAFAVDAHQHFIAILPVAHHQRRVFPAFNHAAVADEPRHPVAGGQVGFRHAANQPFVGAPMGNQLGDAENLEVVPDGELLQLRQPRHAAVLVHNLADHPRRIGPGGLAQVHHRLGMPRPGQHAAVRSPQREHMPRMDEIRRLRRRVNQRAYGGAAVVRRNARGGAPLVVHRSGESGGLRRAGVAAAEQGDVQFVQPRRQHWHTHQPPRVGYHKGDGRRGGMLGEQKQVAFVFAALIVNHNHHFPGGQVVKRLIKAA